MIPHYGDKYDAEALYAPADTVTGTDDFEVPPAVVLGFQETLSEAARRRGEPVAPHPEREFSVYGLSPSVGYFPVADVGVGAPVAAIAAEKVVAAGASVVVVLGGCGAFRTDLAAETVLLPTRAVRDEGVSYHYLPDGEPVTATPGLVDWLAESLRGDGIATERGPTWTTSALFRETLPEIDHYREEGFVSLDMETAAVWAVCQYRGAESATVHHVDDYLSRDVRVDESDRERRLPDLLDPTVRALETYVTA